MGFIFSRAQAAIIIVCVILVLNQPARAASEQKFESLLAILALLLDDTPSPLVPASVFSLVDATSTKKDEVQLNWLPSNDIVTPSEEIEYRVYVSETEAFQVSQAQFSITTVGLDFATISGLTADTQYYAKVTATNADQQISWSNELPFKTPLRDIALKTTEVVEEVSAANSVTVSSSEIRFPTSSEVVGTEGSVLISVDPENSFFRRITSTETLNGETTLTTEQGSIVELFDSFEFNSRLRLEDLQSENPETTQKSKVTTTTIADSYVASKSWKNGLTLIDRANYEQKIEYKPIANPQGASINQKTSVESKIVSGDYLTFSIPEINVARVGEVLEVPITTTVFNEICTSGFWSTLLADSACSAGTAVTPTLCNLSTKITNTPKGVDAASSRPILSFDRTTLIWAPLSQDLGINDDPYEISITYNEGLEEDNCNVTHNVVSKKIKIYLEQGDHQVDQQEQELEESLEVNGEVQLTLTNTVTTSFEPEITIFVKKSPTLNVIENAEISVTGTLNLKQQLVALANASASVTAQKKIVDKSFTKVFSAGPVPILVRGTLTVDLISTAEANGEMNLTEKLDDTFTINLGAVYDRSNSGWESVKTHTNEFSIDIAGDANAELDLESRLSVSFELSFYEAASAILIAEPYLYSEFGVEGSFNYQVNNGLVSNDRNYSLTKLDAGYGVDVSLFAGLTVFDKTIVAYPFGARYSDPSSYQNFQLIDKTLLFQLPELELTTDTSTSNPTDSRAMLLSANATNYPNPTPFGDQFLLPFSQWNEMPSIVESDSQCDGVSSPHLSDRNLFWFVPDLFGTCTFRIAGNSNLGRYARQTVETSYIIEDTDANSIPDYWQARFNLTDLSLDSDNDGLTDADEYTNTTNPRLEDTDGDGSQDGTEVDFETDPNDPNDFPNISIISVESASGLEGNSGDSRFIDFNVKLDRFTDITTVDYQTVDGQALASDNDYTATQGTLSFSGGSTNETIRITITGDDRVEADELFVLRLTNPSGATFAGRSAEILASGVIINDDQSTTIALNDTGITFGGDYPSGNKSTCTSNIVSGQSGSPFDLVKQDCDLGLDTTQNDDSDGHAGFSFTKLDSMGSELPASASNWHCVRDNVTGLIWETKTDDDSVHDKNNTYNWGGNTAQGTGYGTYYSDWNTLVDGSNASNFCGFSDWRVPNIDELVGIVNMGQVNPALETVFFPNYPIGDKLYWTSSPVAGYSTGAWYVDFYSGIVNSNNRTRDYSVRLVRGNQ